MSNQVDKFFASKLGDHSIAPDAKAWSRIASNLPKKNSAIIWLRAAAGIAIAGLALLLWFYSGTNEPTINNVAQEIGSIETKDEAVNKQTETIKPKESAPVRNDQTQETLLAASKDQYPKKQIKSKVANKSQQMMPVEPAIEIAQTTAPETLVEQIETIDLTRSQPSAEVSTKPIVIVYELKQVEKKENPFELDLSPQKKSGIKKVLEIANDVRTGESPIGGLRQAKEEILAFNFKKEEKNNNK